MWQVMWGNHQDTVLGFTLNHGKQVACFKPGNC